MRVGFKLKHYIFNAFRELFVHHHGSLEFRAKILALIIGVDENFALENFTIVKNIGLEIYNGDEDRANLLLLTTQELVKKLHQSGGLTPDILIADIVHELKVIPRYAKKIETQPLSALLLCTKDEETLAYQENIVEFLDKLKDETLQSKHREIAEYEKSNR